jgi:S-adenosylmethionine synthetase
MPKSVLVTGATGLLGRQVVIAFEREGWTVAGTGYTRAKQRFNDGAAHDGFAKALLKVDLGSEAEVTKVLDEVK